jgi:hypothetical protein
LPTSERRDGDPSTPIGQLKGNRGDVAEFQESERGGDES